MVVVVTLSLQQPVGPLGRLEPLKTDADVAHEWMQMDSELKVASVERIAGCSKRRPSRLPAAIVTERHYGAHDAAIVVPSGGVESGAEIAALASEAAPE